MEKIPIDLRNTIIIQVKSAVCLGLSLFQAIHRVRSNWLKEKEIGIGREFPNDSTIYKWIKDYKKQKEINPVENAKTVSSDMVKTDSVKVDIMGVTIKLENYSVIDQKNLMLIRQPVLSCELDINTGAILNFVIVENRNLRTIWGKKLSQKGTT